MTNWTPTPEATKLAAARTIRPREEIQTGGISEKLFPGCQTNAVTEIEERDGGMTLAGFVVLVAFCVFLMSLAIAAERTENATTQDRIEGAAR